MLSSRPRVATLVAALACALAFAGCSDDETDPGDAMSTWTPSGTVETPSATPTESLTEVPKDETAKQFIRRWVALSNRLQETGDDTAFLAVAGPDCEPCHAFAKRLVKIYENNGYVLGGTEHVVSLRPESRTQWVVTLSAEPTEYVESKGADPKTLPGGQYKSRMYLARVNGHWIVGYTEGLPL